MHPWPTALRRPALRSRRHAFVRWLNAAIRTGLDFAEYSQNQIKQDHSRSEASCDSSWLMLALR